MKEVLPHIYQLDIPLKGSPLCAIHPNLIIGSKRHLLIDTTFNTDECENALLEQMQFLNASPGDTDVFLTHLHVDHCGLISRLKTEKNTIENNLWAGVPEDDALRPEQHVAFLNQPSFIVPIETLQHNPLLHIQLLGSHNKIAYLP